MAAVSVCLRDTVGMRACLHAHRPANATSSDEISSHCVRGGMAVFGTGYMKHDTVREPQV